MPGVVGLLPDEVPLQLAAVNLVEVVAHWLVCPGHTALQGVHYTHMHDGANIRQVPLSDPTITEL